MLEHTPVMSKEVIKFLAPHHDENFIDATCGLGGHAKLILEKISPNGKLLAIDQDGVALEKAEKNLKKFADRVTFAHDNFSELGLLIRDWKVSRVDGILFDLGVSNYQFSEKERGFSFNQNARLDMRMSPERQRVSAYEIINRYDLRELKKILSVYGEEPFAQKIAKEIVRVRDSKPIETTTELVEVIRRATPPKYRFSQKKHFATSTFRALRMAVNDELGVLESGLKQAVGVLSPGGRIVVISFHSLEDRIVKNFFRENTALKILTPKPIIASTEEISQNPKARSAKLRAAIKIFENL